MEYNISEKDRALADEAEEWVDYEYNDDLPEGTLVFIERAVNLGACRIMESDSSAVTVVLGNGYRHSFHAAGHDFLVPLINRSGEANKSRVGLVAEIHLPSPDNLGEAALKVTEMLCRGN